jgi:hypothetical protein
MARTLVPTTTLTPPKATLTTSISGTNNDLVYTAKTGGPAGNSIRIQYVVSGTSTAFALAVQGFDIVVTSATDGGGAATTTSAALKSAIEASFDASRLVTVAHAASNDGTGVLATLAATALAGGSLQTSQPSLTNGDATNDHYFTGNDGLTVIEVVSSDAGAQTVSVLYSPNYAPIATVAAQSESIAAGATRILGPFSKSAFDQNASGDVYFDPSVSNTLDFRVYKIVQATT